MIIPSEKNQQNKNALAHRLLQYACYLSVATLLLLGMLHIIQRDILYETDIARDMLLLQQMVDERKISFIGGRSSIPGVFHGPLYYWLVLPVFVVFGGNPLSVSYVWIAWYWLFLGVFYWVGKKVVGNDFALISTTVLASATVFVPAGFTHTVVANFLIVPFLYAASVFIKENKTWQLVAALLLGGLLIQFQMAFGVPALICVGVYVVAHIVKRKQWKQFFAFLVLLLPLGTFLVFDLRHDFIQARSVATYFTKGNNTTSFDDYRYHRIHSLVDSFNMLTLPWEQIRNGISIGALGCLVLLALRNGKSPQQNAFITVAMCVIFGFWIITLPFKGIVWSQYYRPLLPVIIFCFTFFLWRYIPKKFSTLLITLIIGSNIFFSLRSGIEYWRSKPTDDEIHWRFYREMAADIFRDSQNEPFGYFVFSPDQYGYQGKYALKYFSKEQGKEAASYKKKETTYLVIAPNDGKNPWANETFWQKDQVKIEKEPDKVWSYVAGYSIRKFHLNEEELSIEADPYLLDGIHFR